MWKSSQGYYTGRHWGCHPSELWGSTAAFGAELVPLFLLGRDLVHMCCRVSWCSQRGPGVQENGRFSVPAQPICAAHVQGLSSAEVSGSPCLHRGDHTARKSQQELCHHWAFSLYGSSLASKPVDGAAQVL